MVDTTQSSLIEEQPKLRLRFVVFATLALLRYIRLKPRREPNNDIEIAMVANEYCNTRASSSHLLVSNIIWGKQTQSQPERVFQIIFLA